MVKDSGIITILDIDNGKQLQQLRAEGRGNYYASLVAGDGKVYAISEIRCGDSAAVRKIGQNTFQTRSGRASYGFARHSRRRHLHSDGRWTVRVCQKENVAITA